MGMILNNLRVDLNTHVYSSDKSILQRIADYVASAVGKVTVKSINEYRSTIELIVKQKNLPSSITVNGSVSTAIMTELRNLDTSKLSHDGQEDLKKVLEDPNLCSTLYYITYTQLGSGWEIVIRF